MGQEQEVVFADLDGTVEGDQFEDNTFSDVEAEADDAFALPEPEEPAAEATPETDDDLAPVAEDDDLEGVIEAETETEPQETLDDDKAELRRELALLQQERVQRQQAEAQQHQQEAINARDRKLDKLQTDLELAIEDGDSSKQASIQREMAKASVIETPQPTTTAPAAPAKENPKAQAYMRENMWFGNPAYQQETQAMMRLDEQIRAQGFDPNTDAYYAELTARMKPQYPDLFKAAPRQAPTKPRNAVSGVNRGSEASPVTRKRDGDLIGKMKKGKLPPFTADARDIMLRFGMNPQDKAQRTAFLQNRRVTLLREHAAKQQGGR